MLLHDRYEILCEIGKGGSARVYKVFDLRLQMHFACKCIALQDEKNKTSFYRELKILTTLHHSNIPRVIDQFEEESYAYVIMEHIEGMSVLDYVLEHGNIHEKQVLSWMLIVIDIFLYLHNLKPEPLLYLDLKPQNIMISKSGKLYLIDFGSSTLGTQITPISATKGYAPKELMKQHQVSKGCDIYSFGVTFYVLLHGHFPKEAKKVSPLDKALLKCCKKDVKKRFQSFEEVKKNVRKQMMKRSMHLYKMILLIILSLIMVWVGCYEERRIQESVSVDYLNAMKEENYLEAMKLSNGEVEPYRRYYEQQCTIENTCEKALLEMESQAIKWKHDTYSQVAFFIASKAIEQQDTFYFQMAYKYLGYVKSEQGIERNAIENLRYILQVLTQRQLNASQQIPLSKALKELEAYANSRKDIEEQYVYEHILLILYEQQHLVLDEANETILRICTKMKSQIQDTQNGLDMTKLTYLDERIAYAYYRMGMNDYTKQMYTPMKQHYKQSISYFLNSETKDRFSILSSMYLQIFEYAIDDQEKRNYVSILQEAKKYAAQIPQANTRLYMEEMIERKLRSYVN
ncbi:MAG: serine/threonine-protein kinase [Longicatena sp.]